MIITCSRHSNYLYTSVKPYYTIKELCRALDRNDDKKICHTRVGVGVTRMAEFQVKQCQKSTTNRQILTDSNDGGTIYKLSIHIHSHSHSHILILHRMYMIYVNLPI